MSPAVERVLAALDARGYASKAQQGYWMARCPAHDDATASLSVKEGGDGRVLMKCHGCGRNGEEIAPFLGLETRDLFVDGGGATRGGGGGVGTPPGRRATPQHPPRGDGITLAQYARAKGLPVEFLRKLGLRDLSYRSRPAVAIPYYDPGDQEAAVQFRVSLNGEDRFRWRKGSKTCLYGLSHLEDARRTGYVTIVEGASDVQTLWLHGEPALGLPGASNWNEKRDAGHLEGTDVIYVVREPDQGGQAVEDWVSKSSIRDRVRFLHLPGAKDPSELHLQGPATFPEAWHSAREAAVPWRAEADAKRKTRRDLAWERCRDLATCPHILAKFSSAVREAGLVGEVRAATLLFLALVSRLLQHPISVGVKGPSSGGKSYVVERALSFFPDSAYHALTGMSDKALVYGEEPLSHRFLVIFEAVGLGEGFGAYAIRSLLSEGRLCYETVDKTDGGFKARRIEREGPTGLIFTTTAVAVHAENETRFISITITDTPEQTRQILLAMTEDEAEPEDLDKWHALQAWLEAGERRVVIPYRRALAERFEPVAVRLRRDFRAILGLIQAHALLHQATRERDDEGRIVATVEDYRTVRDLVADLVSHGVGTTVPATVRATVEAVRTAREDTGKIETSYAAIGRALKLDRSTVSRRVREAISRGFLRNEEDKKGKPARIVLADPLPDDIEILPEPDALEGECCSVAEPREGVDTPPSPLVDGGDDREACTCSGCQESGVQHGARCLCGACIDADPQWEGWRQEVDAERAKGGSDE